MIDQNKAIQAFKEKFEKMSYSEREQYLKDMGFSFGDDQKTYKHLSVQISEHHFSTVKRNKTRPDPLVISQLIEGKKSKKNFMSTVAIKKSK